MLTVSAGVTSFVPGSGLSTEVLLRQADRALYAAKAAVGARSLLRQADWPGHREKQPARDLRGQSGDDVTYAVLGEYLS